ncbi:MAG: TIGR03013 family XrtA/PEP-CTERM system glycosyltransferase [Stellaceae bacterium]
MLRIFGHFVPAPALALAFSEILLLAAAFYFVNAPAEAAELRLVLRPAEASLGAAALAVVAMLAVGLYHYDVFLDPRLMALKALTALLLLAPLAAAGALLSEDALASGGDWAVWCLKASFAWMLSVLLTRSVFLNCAGSERFRRPIVVIGTGVRAGRIAELLRAGGNRLFRPLGFIHACGDLRIVLGAKLDLDRAEDEGALARYAAEAGAREVVVATDERRGLPVRQLLHCKTAGINVIEYLTFWERETRKIELDSLQPSWLVFSDGFRQGWLIDLGKRCFDIAVSLALLVFTLPLMALAALAVLIEDGWPVFYRQERVGRGGVGFTLMKFRSMRKDAESAGLPQWARNADPRVTRTGSIIRKVRVDELPQLLNVLKGDMSFVGPRPERPFFVAELARAIPFYTERHCVKPGITGWAQINYPYGASLDDARQKLAYDLYYVKNRTLFLDFLILIQTARVVLFQEGAR